MSVITSDLIFHHIYFVPRCSKRHIKTLDIKKNKEKNFEGWRTYLVSGSTIFSRTQEVKFQNPCTRNDASQMTENGRRKPDKYNWRFYMLLSIAKAMSWLL